MPVNIFISNPERTEEQYNRLINLIKNKLFIATASAVLIILVLLIVFICVYNNLTKQSSKDNTTSVTDTSSYTSLSSSATASEGLSDSSEEETSSFETIEKFEDPRDLTVDEFEEYKDYYETKYESAYTTYDEPAIAHVASKTREVYFQKLNPKYKKFNFTNEDCDPYKNPNPTPEDSNIYKIPNLTLDPSLSIAEQIRRKRLNTSFSTLNDNVLALIQFVLIYEAPQSTDSLLTAAHTILTRAFKVLTINLTTPILSELQILIESYSVAFALLKEIKHKIKNKVLVSKFASFLEFLFENMQQIFQSRKIQKKDALIKKMDKYQKINLVLIIQSNNLAFSMVKYFFIVLILDQKNEFTKKNKKFKYFYDFIIEMDETMFNDDATSDGDDEADTDDYYGFTIASHKTYGSLTIAGGMYRMFEFVDKFEAELTRVKCEEILKQLGTFVENYNEIVIGDVKS